ncbi:MULTISPECIES: hypothetical protein [unclassified Corallococcus]|uniref:hypothetical protein n=1 Tax=unclassified Corallococcus TaxID=2685029 RepID=UPI001A8D9FD1|nr:MULTISPECIES: hypothetical protein [unclassified Corallococcus]MBN9684107.1 hypothetical protein [Corallococcus sp. NCSPR001]WAS84403.1 hypothetical protein O0N60_34635 [Corallococcus sp. NCRR]
MRTFLIGGLLAMAVGCGGPMEQESEPNLATQEATLPDCSNEPNANLHRYYSDAAHTQLIGEYGCYCGGLYYWGGRSVYSEYIQEC